MGPIRQENVRCLLSEMLSWGSESVRQFVAPRVVLNLLSEESHVHGVSLDLPISHHIYAGCLVKTVSHSIG